MSDNVKALVAEARERFSYASGYVEMRQLAIRLADALEAVTAENDRIMGEWTRAEAELSARPLVGDREAVAEFLRGEDVYHALATFHVVDAHPSLYEATKELQEWLASGAAAYRTSASPTGRDSRQVAPASLNEG